MKPYYEHAGITIYHGDCREILPQLGVFDLLLTDPPYGIGLDMVLHHGTSERSIHESSDWNSAPPSPESFDLMYAASRQQIIWGCNYFGSSIRDLGRIVHDKCLLIEGTALSQEVLQF